KLNGEYALVHTGARGAQYGGSRDGERNWLMIKKRDEWVVEGFDANSLDVSVKTGRSLDQIAADEGGDPRELRRRAARDKTSSAGRAPVRAELKPPPAPMLATPVADAFSRTGWLFELKYDGVRALASLAGDELRIVGRSGRDETARYPELRAMVRSVRARH